MIRLSIFFIISLTSTGIPEIISLSILSNPRVIAVITSSPLFTNLIAIVLPIGPAPIILMFLAYDVATVI